MHPDQSLPFGADLVEKGWMQVTLDRADNPPLSFFGSQVTRHWKQLYDGRTIGVTLWRHKTFGFVVAFTASMEDRLSEDCVPVDSLEEAIRFLEDYCAHPPLPDPPSGPLIDSLLHVLKTAHFAQSFASVVGEALGTWVDLDYDLRDSGLKQGTMT